MPAQHSGAACAGDKEGGTTAQERASILVYWAKPPSQVMPIMLQVTVSSCAVLRMEMLTQC